MNNQVITIKDIVVTISGEIKMVDNGIGHYEFWGTTGFDTQIEPEIQNIIWDKSLYTDEENIIIDKYIDDNFDELSDLIEVSLTDDDYPEEYNKEYDEEYENDEPISPC